MERVSPSDCYRHRKAHCFAARRPAHPAHGEFLKARRGWDSGGGLAAISGQRRRFSLLGAGIPLPNAE